MPLLPAHKILPDINSNGHPANVISIITVAGLNSNTVQSAIEEINLNVSENANTTAEVFIKANSAYELANTANKNAANASFLSTGIINTTVLGSGTANANTVLYGDNTWKVLEVPAVDTTTLIMAQAYLAHTFGAL